MLELRRALYCSIVLYHNSLEILNILIRHPYFHFVLGPPGSRTRHVRNRICKMIDMRTKKFPNVKDVIQHIYVVMEMILEEGKIDEAKEMTN